MPLQWRMSTSTRGIQFIQVCLGPRINLSLPGTFAGLITKKAFAECLCKRENQWQCEKIEHDRHLLNNEPLFLSAGLETSGTEVAGRSQAPSEPVRWETALNEQVSNKAGSKPIQSHDPSQSEENMPDSRKEASSQHQMHDESACTAGAEEAGKEAATSQEEISEDRPDSLSHKPKFKDIKVHQTEYSSEKEQECIHATEQENTDVLILGGMGIC
jgi:hypothetical protein